VASPAVRAGKLSITIDVPQLERGVARTNRTLQAFRDTVNRIRSGDVVGSRRKKLPHEVGNVAHGAFILNIFRRRGIEPINRHSQATINYVVTMINRRIARAIRLAVRDHQVHSHMVEQAFLSGAEYLARRNREYIKGGRLGRKPTEQVINISATKRNRAHTRRLSLMPVYERRARAGKINPKYGMPPPVGIMTGRLVDGDTGGVRDGIRGVLGRPIVRA